MFGRNIVQKDLQKSTDVKDLGLKLKKPPFIFTSAELYDIKDNAGMPYSKKYSKEFITDFINNALVKKENEDLPFLIKIAPDSNKEYYICRDMVSHVFLKKLVETSKEIRDKFFREWGDALKKFKKTYEMRNDEIFIETIISIVKADYKIFNALLNPSLIFLANKSPAVNSSIKTSIDSCFETPVKFKSMDKLLNLGRNDLIKQIRASIPAYYSLPFIGKIVSFFSNLLLGKSKPKNIPGTPEITEDVFIDMGSLEETDKKAKRNETAGFFESLSKAKKSYLLTGKNMEQSLAELAEKWNHLVNKQARQNLTEDINSLIRDFIRARRKILQRYSITQDRIDALAIELVNKTAKLGINVNDSFRHYVKLSIIKALEGK
jgi:hypothetical protein